MDMNIDIDSGITFNGCKHEKVQSLLNIVRDLQGDDSTLDDCPCFYSFWVGSQNYQAKIASTN